MTQVLLPEGWQAPATYSHGIAVPATARTIYVAGQVGITSGGEIPVGISAQTRCAFENIRAVLRAGGLDLQHVVKTTVFLIEPADYAEFGKARTEMLGTSKPASTLVYIKQLVRPEFLVEVEAVAVG